MNLCSFLLLIYQILITVVRARPSYQTFYLINEFVIIDEDYNQFHSSRILQILTVTYWIQL